jgi:hypothetical protein
LRDSRRREGDPGENGFEIPLRHRLANDRVDLCLGLLDFFTLKTPLDTKARNCPRLCQRSRAITEAPPAINKDPEGGALRVINTQGALFTARP